MTILKAVITLLVFSTTVVVNAQNNNYTFFKSQNEAGKHEWILLLPGSSGFTIFNDAAFYNRKADYLNKLGYDILLLDYKSFYQASTSLDKPKGTTGEKISWVLKQVIQLAKDNQQIGKTSKGHIIGWSLAGEGVFRLLKDTSFVSENKISSAALFYPSNNEKLEVTTSIPLLIQIGQSDKSTVADKLQKQISNNEKIKFIRYPNCFHGFDIETITEPKTIKFPPVIGKKHVFLYNKESAEKAYLELIKFLEQ